MDILNQESSNFNNNNLLCKVSVIFMQPRNIKSNLIFHIYCTSAIFTRVEMHFDNLYNFLSSGEKFKQLV